TSNLRFSLKRFHFEPQGDCAVSYLPLSHITARHLDYAYVCNGLSIAYCPRMEDLTEGLLEAHPTFFVGVPRVYEKVRQKVEQKAASGLKNKIYKWAIEVGRRHLPEVLAGRTPSSLSWKLANLLLYAKIRDGFGGRVRAFCSGGAPLGRDLATWYACVGIRLHEGYGWTETS